MPRGGRAGRVLGAALVAAAGLVLAVRTGAHPAAPSDVADGCPADGPPRATTLVSAVRLDGRTYVRAADLDTGVRTDRLVGTTRCRISDRTPADHLLRDGDATAVPAGTPVLTLAGVDPAVAVTALVSGRPVRFNALPGLRSASCESAATPGGGGTAVGESVCVHLSQDQTVAAGG